MALIALELLMSFSFLGYFHIEPISITIAYIPVLLAGALVGPVEAAAVGTAFGLASMWKASASYVAAMDRLFSPIQSGNPIGSIVLSVGSRMLFGLAVGLLYLAVRRLRPQWLWLIIVSFFGRVIHSLMVYGAMAVCFPEAGYGPADAFSDFFAPMNLISGLGAAGAVLAFWLIYRSRIWKRFRRYLAMYRAVQVGDQYNSVSLTAVLVLTLISALAVTFYFVNRMSYVLEVDGINISDSGYADIFHLQLQFLFGIISLMVLLTLFLILNRRYTSCMAVESQQDSLTGTMTRRAFFAACNRVLQSMKGQSRLLGYFIMVDLDHFKEINDSFGHPEGDRALKEVAKALKEVFNQNCIVGRMGGDEFALLVYEDMPESELEFLLRHFLDRVHRVAWGTQHLCCSVGVLRILASTPLEDLYLEADQLLYAAKEKGRNQYVMGSASSAQTDACS